jgi:hypothetical protein
MFRCVYSGVMKKETFITAGQRLYGKHGWKTQLAETLGMSRATIHRYANGELAIPGRVALAMQALEAAR